MGENIIEILATKVRNEFITATFHNAPHPSSKTNTKGKEAQRNRKATQP